MLSILQRNSQSAAIDRIVPATDGMPAASEVGGLEYLIELSEEDPNLLHLFKERLDRLNGVSNEKYTGNFVQLSQAEQVEVLKELEDAVPAFFENLRNYTYEE